MKVISRYAFQECDLRGTLDLSSIRMISPYAFAGNKKLEGVTTGDTLLSIGEYAFAGCEKLKDVTITAEKVTIDSASVYQCSYSDAQSGGLIIYEFTAEKNGFLCLDFDVTDRNSYTVYLNGEKLYSESLSLPQMIAASNVEVGDVVRVELKCKSGEDGRTTVKAAILNGSYFRTGVEILSRSTLNLTTYESTHVAGTIECDRDGLLYTSIPQDGNWKVFVDGVQVEYTLVGDCMIGVKLQQGTHEVEYVYENEAFSYGWKISLAFALVFLICVLAAGKQKTGKYQK